MTIIAITLLCHATTRHGRPAAASGTARANSRIRRSTGATIARHGPQMMPNQSAEASPRPACTVMAAALAAPPSEPNVTFPIEPPR